MGLHHARVARLLVPSLSVALAVALAATSAFAQPPGAQTLPCRVDPFGGESVADRASMLARGCGGERVDYRLEALRDRPTDPGPSRVAAQVDAATSQRLGDGLLGTLRMNWSAAGSEAQQHLLRTERTAWAAGTWWQLHRFWAVQMNLGREFTAEPRTRATVAGVWRPIRNAVVFAEWAGTPDATEARRVGLRWWLVRNRLALEAGARHLADGSWADERLSLTFGLLR